MSRAKDGKKKPRGKPGPKPDALHIPGPWEEAVRKMIRKKKPPTGWPKK